MNLSTRNKISVNAGMSSMTDLVFLLLIFFIIISTLVSNGVNVDLPSSNGTTSVNKNITLSIKADGSYSFKGLPKSINRTDLAPKPTEKGLAFISQIQAEMDEQNENILYLQVDQAVLTGQTVELIGIAKDNQWKVMLGANPAKK
jgi:biopolymer transport protein ExbD